VVFRSFHVVKAQIMAFGVVVIAVVGVLSGGAALRPQPTSSNKGMAGNILILIATSYQFHLSIKESCPKVTGPVGRFRRHVRG
jgi:predicted metal-binding membrane protein